MDKLFIYTFYRFKNLKNIKRYKTIFDNFLYKRNIQILSNKYKLNVLKPLSYYEAVINLISKKLVL